MSRAYNHSFGFKFNYFELVLEGPRGDDAFPHTVVARVPLGSDPDPMSWSPDTIFIELIPMTETELAYFLGVKLPQVNN